MLLLANPFTSLAAEILKPVGLKDVKLTDGFWKQKLDVNREVTVWHNFKLCEETGRISNFAKAAGLEQGKHQGAFFNDSDLYKVMEGASYILAQHPDDQKLDEYLDNLIAIIAKAQMPDGYLYTFYQLGDMSKKFTNLKDMHELYCGGHLIEAGVAHYQCTGKRTLLSVAIKYADLLDKTFGEDKRHEVCGHEEIELALFKLADATGEQKYAKLASYFIHQRGRDDGRKLFGNYHQDDKPLEQSDQVVGHAVRQMYFLCGAADVTAHGDDTFVPAMNRLWHDMVDRKMYVTGGVGAIHGTEAFGEPYQLPNESAYAETCAGIGNAFWNERMNLLTADAKYFDVIETASYNGILSGLSLDGAKFFYVNPLASRGKHHRQRWYDCACCPPNLVRYFASLPDRIYATANNDVYVNLYAASEASVPLDGRRVSIKQVTDYPWSGEVKFTFDGDVEKLGALKLRIPAWCEGAKLQINGKAANKLQIDKGYATISRSWKAGDVVALSLPMPARRVHANAMVKDDVGRVAIARGPVVYCAEAIDNKGRVSNLVLPKDAQIETRPAKDVLGGVTMLSTKALAKTQAGGSPQPLEATLIPYYAWDNRDAGEMAVWLAEDPAVATTPPAPTIANQSKLSASHCFDQDTIDALNDGIEPKSSFDTSIPRFTWWPRKGSTEWAQYDFADEQEVSSVDVYFFDDEPSGGCRLPASWKLMYKSGDAWKPVDATADFATAKDDFNHVSFKPMKASGLRIEAQLKEGFSGGILEWRVK